MKRRSRASRTRTTSGTHRWASSSSHWTHCHNHFSTSINCWWKCQISKSQTFSTTCCSVWTYWRCTVMHCRMRHAITEAFLFGAKRICWSKSKWRLYRNSYNRLDWLHVICITACGNWAMPNTHTSHRWVCRCSCIVSHCHWVRMYSGVLFKRPFTIPIGRCAFRRLKELRSSPGIRCPYY